MGQKVNPLGFRLGITQFHKSQWYTNTPYYSILAKEDDKIRLYIQSKFTKKGSISGIKIYRDGGSGDNIQIIIRTARPGLIVGENCEVIKTLAEDLQNKILPATRRVTFKIEEIENINSDAYLISELVVQQLEDRVAFRRAMREGIQCIQDDEVNGIKIQVSGRLNGAEIARKEWIREGRVPLQTLRADIDYSTNEANTIYGVLGVKVWLFKNEKF